MPDKKITILYVEDEPSLARIVSETLTMRNFIVHHIEDGSRAVDAFDRIGPDLCVLDIMLPGKDGYTVAQEIREKRTHVPILFLTAKVQTKDVIKGFESGGHDYLKKPFSMEELIVRINNLIALTTERKKEAPKSDHYSLGSFDFYPPKYELRNGKKVIHLSHRESRLLELLCRYKNDTCDRKEILMEIWGDDSYFNSRTLDVYINKLRKQFARVDSVNIVTLKGVGYLFKVEK